MGSKQGLVLSIPDSHKRAHRVLHSNDVDKVQKPKSTKPSDQVRAFRKAARELGCEDSEDRFKAALRTVGKAKPSAEKPKSKSGRDS
jgi:hypothetical protein